MQELVGKQVIWSMGFGTLYRGFVKWIDHTMVYITDVHTCDEEGNPTSETRLYDEAINITHINFAGFTIL